ncbi:expressed unknown protein [Seminavis robusta]|uniref:Uncharacterized protein n=1 Tax=Seminavis robusta TaxID=568900 RepID=A0A9N8HN06_9STRA|nr:expressed unknown protein [Seminavis robusta]|eukprot:Sro947_g223400.1 n/a (266) ;mRNA; f:10850-11647
MTSSFLFLLCLLLLHVLSDHPADAAAFLVQLPYGGICFNFTSPSDGAMDVACIVSQGAVTPSPASTANETIYIGQFADDYSWVRGFPNNDTGNEDDPLGFVRVGYTHEGTQDCVISAGNTDCCSCSSCLNANGDLVGMKADCSNVPYGRVIDTCENTTYYFPFDMSLNGETAECNVDDPMFSGPTEVPEDDSGGDGEEIPVTTTADGDTNTTDDNMDESSDNNTSSTDETPDGSTSTSGVVQQYALSISSGLMAFSGVVMAIVGV